MSNEEKKKILNNFQKIEGRIRELEEEQEVLWSRITSASQNLNGMPKGNTGENKILNAIERLERLTNLIDGERDELADVQQAIMSAVRKLPNITERRIIHLKYIGKAEGLYHKTLPLWKIANELGYSPDRINHMHGDALRHLDL